MDRAASRAPGTGGPGSRCSSSCNNLQNAGATTYIFGLQLSTFSLCNKYVRRRNGPNNFIRPSNCHLILEGFFRQKQTISDDLQNAVCLLPALKNKALTISDELRPNTKFRTPTRQAVGSNPAGCAIGLTRLYI